MESGTTVPRRAVAQHALLPGFSAWRRAIWVRREVLALGAVTALGLGVRLWNLGSKSLWIDETFSIGMVSQSWHGFAGTLLGVQPNMEFFYILLKFAATLTPAAWQRGEVFWRLLPALAGTATIPALYALARRISSVRVALVAAALVAVNEFMVEYSQQARGYTLFVLLFTLSWLALVRALCGERRAWIWFAMLAALGFLTQAFEIVFLVAQLAFVAFVALRRRALPWQPLLASLLPLALVVILRYPLYAAHPDQVAWIQRPTLSDLFHGTRQLVGGDGGIPSRLGDLALLLTLASIAWLVIWAGMQGRDTKGAKAAKSAKITRSDATALAVGWFVIPIALTWVGSQVKPVWVTRYLAPCSVAACLIVAAAIVALAETFGKRWADGKRAVETAPKGVATKSAFADWGLGVLAVLALCAWLGPLRDYQARPGWEDWRGAALAVNATYQAGDGVVCYDNQWGCDFGFSHYWQSFGGPAYIDPTAPGAFSWATYAQADREAIFARAVQPQYLAPYLAKHGRVWVLLGHYANGAGDWRAGLAWLCAHAHLLQHINSVGDINVYLFAAGRNQSDVYHHS
jgi:4-amino-4-deoxy-L-arabinose transferase-like glycosyltransferase